MLLTKFLKRRRKLNGSNDKWSIMKVTADSSWLQQYTHTYRVSETLKLELTGSANTAWICFTCGNFLDLLLF